MNNGASIGFLPPMPESQAGRYWNEVISKLSVHNYLIAAFLDDKIVGSVQLNCSEKLNALHRAEVSKLMVLSECRRMGIGTKLMTELEDLASKLNKTTLVLDTRKGDASEKLYQSLDWKLSGEIPQYARSASGSLHTTVFYYKLLIGIDL